MTYPTIQSCHRVGDVQLIQSSVPPSDDIQHWVQVGIAAIELREDEMRDLMEAVIQANPYHAMRKVKIYYALIGFIIGLWTAVLVL